MQGKEEESTHLGVMLEVVVGEDPDVTLDLGVRLRRLGDGREGDEQKDTEIHGACGWADDEIWFSKLIFR